MWQTVQFNEQSRAISGSLQTEPSMKFLLGRGTSRHQTEKDCGRGKIVTEGYFSHNKCYLDP